MSTRVTRGLAAAFLLCLACPEEGLWGQSPGAELPTVAVMDFTGFLLGEGGNSAPLGKAVSAMLVTEFVGRPGLHVIERHQLAALIQEQKLALSGLVDEGQAVEIGKLVGAQYMLFGAATAAGGTLRMDVRAVDVETSEILAVDKLSGKTEELLDLVVRAADNFGGKLNLSPPSDRPDVEAVPARATIEFSRALDSEDKGDLDKAIEHYRNTLEIHPHHQGAKRALERLESGGGSDA